MNKDDNLNKKIVLLIATLSAFITPFMGSSINIALPAIGSRFNMGALALSWVATSYLLAAALFLVPFGRLSDIYGRKRFFLMGIIVFTVSSALATFSTSAEMLLISRVLQGIGSSMIFCTSLAIVTSAYPAGERGKVLGINVASTYIGLSVGPFLGGWLTDNFGWRSIFAVNIPLGIAVIVLVLWKLKEEWAEAQGESFDLSGAIIYGIALVSLMAGFSLLPGVQGGVLIGVGVLAFVVFGIWENRVKSPVLEIKLFNNNRVLTFSSLAALINYSATYAISFLLSLYLQYIKGFTPEVAGVVLIAQPLMQAVFSPFAGRLSDKVEPRIVASSGMAITALGLFMLVFNHDGTQMAYIVICLIFLGFGFALFSSPNTNAIMGSVERRYYGVASGILSTMRLIGQVFSMGITTLVFTLYIGRVQITPEYYNSFLYSMRAIFIIMTALCVAGVFASLSRGSVRKQE